MKLTNITKRCLLGTSLLIPALAINPTSAEEPLDLEKLLVTASRTPISIHQAGSSYTIIDAVQIEQRHALHISDLLREVPGITVSQSGGIGAQTQIRLRGAEADQTLVLIDGIEANDPSQGSVFDFAHMLTSDIERIEIIRGPQSSLWGSDAMAGVINIITKQAGEGSKVSGQFEAGSFSTTHGTVGLSNRGNNYHFSMNGSFVNSDGSNVAEQGNEDDGYKNTTFNLKGGFNPLDNLELSLVARHTSAEIEYDPSPFPSYLPSDGDRVSENNQSFAMVKAKLDLMDGNWEHITSVTLTDTDNDNFADGVKTNTTQGKKLKFTYQSNVFFDTPRFADASHTLTFLAESEKEQIKQTGTASFFGDPNQEQDFTNQAYLAEYRIGLWEKLSASVSARYDDNDVFDNAATYRGTIAYHLPESGTTFRVAYGTAIKNPSFSDRFGFTPDTFIGNPDLEPEKSKGWEIGIDQNFLNDRIMISATLFEERLEDEINGYFFDPVLGGSTAVNIDGKSKREGLELALHASITDSLTINSAYTYVDSTQANTAGKQIREIRRPKHVASLNGNYRFMDNKANINLGFDYTGEQNDSDFSTFPSTLVTLDDYVLVNLAGEYSFSENLSFFGRIENLLDEDYQDVLGYNTPGIAAYAGIKMNLGL